MTCTLTTCIHTILSLTWQENSHTNTSIHYTILTGALGQYASLAVTYIGWGLMGVGWGSYGEKLHLPPENATLAVAIEEWAFNDLCMHMKSSVAIEEWVLRRTECSMHAYVHTYLQWGSRGTEWVFECSMNAYVCTFQWGSGEVLNYWMLHAYICTYLQWGSWGAEWVVWRGRSLPMSCSWTSWLR